MTIQKKITGMVFVALFVLGVSGVALYTVINKPNKPTGTGDASLIYDPSDNRQVVGAHHNIFTGKVLQKLEPKTVHLPPSNSEKNLFLIHYSFWAVSLISRLVSL